MPMRFFSSLLSFGVGVSALLAQTWSTYHGDNYNTGYAPGMGAMSMPTLRWAFNGGGRIWINSPVVGELDGDANLEVVFGTYDNGTYYALHAEDGSLYWSYHLATAQNFGSAVIGDVDGDGWNEVICPFESFNDDTKNQIVCLEHDGTLQWSFSDFWSGWFEAPCKLADVDGDGKLEVVTTSYLGMVYALNAENGSRCWNVAKGTNCFSSPAITPVSINGGSTPDVIVTIYTLPDGGGLYALEGSNGAEIWSNPSAGYGYYTAPVIANITPDPSLEVIACNTEAGAVYCVNIEDGSLNWRYPAAGSIGDIGNTPAVGDLNGDGDNEIVFARDYWPTGTVFALNPDGTLFWSTNLSRITYSSAAICDIDGDGKPEVLIGTISDTSLYCLNGEDGTILWSYPTRGAVVSSPVPVDVEHDGALGVLIGSTDYNLYLLDVKPVYGGSLEDETVRGQRLTATPSAGGITVRFSLADPSPVSLELYDISGALVSRVNLGEIGTGEHTRFIPTRKAGIFFLVLNTRSGSSSTTCLIPER